MFDSLIEYSLRSRGFVLLVLLGLVGSGVYSLLNLPIDAVPDITNVQVMALTSAPALGPEEVEQFITIPVENAMNGIPRIKEVRSFSQFGISGVTIIFEDGTDIYWARQQVGERLDQVRSRSPQEFGQPEMGPIATGLGEIYQFEVRNAADSPQPALADGAADDPRLGGRPPAQERAGRRRGQRPGRRAEDVRGRARPEPAARPRDRAQPGLRGDPPQQRERRRRLHPAQRRAAGHPRRRA